MRAMCGVQLKDRERSMHWMLMLALSDMIDQWAMANGLSWYDHVVLREMVMSCEVYYSLRLKVKG